MQGCSSEGGQKGKGRSREHTCRRRRRGTRQSQPEQATGMQGAGAPWPDAKASVGRGPGPCTVGAYWLPSPESLLGKQHPHAGPESWGGSQWQAGVASAWQAGEDAGRCGQRTRQRQAPWPRLLRIKTTRVRANRSGVHVVLVPCQVSAANRPSLPSRNPDVDLAPMGWQRGQHGPCGQGHLPHWPGAG